MCVQYPEGLWQSWGEYEALIDAITAGDEQRAQQLTRPPAAAPPAHERERTATDNRQPSAVRDGAG